MALGLNVSIRNNRLKQIRDAIDAGLGPGILRIYNGTRPSTLTFSDPSAPDPSGGVLTFNSISPDNSANATGTATWARVLDSEGNFVFDCDVGTSGADINLNSTTIQAGARVEVTSASITEGNA